MGYIGHNEAKMIVFTCCCYGAFYNLKFIIIKYLLPHTTLLDEANF